MLTEKEFDNLCNLVCISFDPQKKSKMIKEVWSITNLLDKISDFSTKFADKIKSIPPKSQINTNCWVLKFEDTDAILSNISHNISAKSIIIKSFVEK